jgi:hypothetical protein
MAQGCVRLQLSRSEMQQQNTSHHLPPRLLRDLFAAAREVAAARGRRGSFSKEFTCRRAGKIIRREIVNLLNRGGPLGAEFMLR